MPLSKNRPPRKPRRDRLGSVDVQLVSASRLRFVFAILAVGLLGLMSRMAWLQVFRTSELQAKARAFQIQRIQPLGARRSIVDRTGRLVALDVQRFRLWAHPNNFRFPGDASSLLRKPDDVAHKLSALISKSKNELVELIGNRVSGIRLAEGLEPEVASEIQKLGISGLELESYLQRVYPQDDLFANVVGFLNDDRIPQAGLEQSLDKTLSRGKEPVRRLRLAMDGTPLPDDLAPGVFYRDDAQLQLTLDSRLQELSAKALTDAISKWNATRGVAIVMNVMNGELLTLASTPSYNPNRFWKYSPALYKEWSVQDLYEPGSTFKPINLALALQEGVIQPDGTVNDTGIINVGGWSLRNYDFGSNGVMNFAEVLQASSNIGMVKAMQNLDPSRYWELLHRLGLNSKPQTDLPGAVAGYLKPKKEFVNKEIEPAVASYGHGFSLTPLKLAQLHALIANGGYLVSPHITRGLKGGDLPLATAADKSAPLLRPEVTRIVRGWMESVVDTGSVVGFKKINGYRIGGKTGTADKLVNGQFGGGLKVCSFVANLPADNPRYVVLVVVDEPKGGDAFGSTVAAPVAKKIIEGLLVLEKIPPSN
ncbi:penicillin-binding protein 2 [Prochlorococcus sp. MIT 1307]|uniref:peptidoglycan D,D-transpeptidase FtsI family protein n=1 Tax=Prochlorococcus sp. MIT 1307 TaxID=3096219 RepID=UPI002A756424|nr:penicillin-binding protein 2 [Prochlorococcus sp. MIT 1307]